MRYDDRDDSIREDIAVFFLFVLASSDGLLYKSIREKKHITPLPADSILYIWQPDDDRIRMQMETVEDRRRKDQ